MAGRYSYLDGVPFAINPIFLPCHNQQEIRDSITDAHHIISKDQANIFALLNYRHKFSHEKHFLAEITKPKNETTKKIHQPQVEQVLTTTTSNQPAIQKNLSYLTASCLNPMPVYSNSNLLEPTQPKSTVSAQPQTTNHVQRQDSSHDLFTPSMSLDPFNDMELKTINDLEELKTILHNHQIDLAKATANTNTTTTVNTTSKCEDLDNFGLPKVSFIDLDINSNKL